MARTSQLPARGFFVTGTDTGVGKTLCSCALLHSFAAKGLSVIGMKPVAAGAVRRNSIWVNDDVTMLRAASTVDAPHALVNPYCFEPPIAPHVAAQQAHIEIDVAAICFAHERLATIADVVVVEGVGGFCVPLNADDDSADLAQAMGLPVVLVVGMRLGCLNHALLTAQAIRFRGLVIAGWIANLIDPAMTAMAENVVALVNRLDAPLLGAIGFLTYPDPQAAAAYLDVNRLELKPSPALGFLPQPSQS